MKTLFRSLSVALLAVALGVTGLAQTNTLTSTTLSATVDSDDTSIQVTSATDFAVGSIVFVDKEAMTISSVVGTVVGVRRGVPTTRSTAHSSGATAFVGTPDLYGTNDPAGMCTTAAEFVLPFVALDTGTVWNCTNSEWIAETSGFGGSIALPTSSSFTIGDTAASYNQGPAFADAVSSIFFIADRAYTVTSIEAVWSTAESTGAMDIQVQRLQGTEAIAAGDDLLSAVIDATGTADTVNAGTLTATAALLDLAAGDRLAVELSATPNEVVNMVVTVGLEVN